MACLAVPATEHGGQGDALDCEVAAERAYMVCSLDGNENSAKKFLCQNWRMRFLFHIPFISLHVVWLPVAVLCQHRSPL